MKSVKKINVISFFAAVTILLIFGYSLSTINTINPFDFFSITDTLDNPYVPEIPSDVSGMFNERGYFNSNSTSFDENEVINDFNGNLMYSIPLYHLKGPGDLNVDLSLNYNGSVQHTVITVDSTRKNDAIVYPLYNINAPEWILSLNGMAIQLTNFETKMFTTPTTWGSVSDNDIRLLATGYQITDRLRPAPSSNGRDAILIMQGDGSVLRLENMVPGEYTGTYYSTNKKDYTRASVRFIYDSPNIPDAYKQREVTITKGDGITYIYEEENVQFLDFKLPSSPYLGNYHTPQILMLKTIKDRFGHYLNINYTSITEDLAHVWGRPLIESIYFNWENVSDINFVFMASTPFGFKIYNNFKGNFTIVTKDQFSLEAGGIHHTLVHQILDPLEREMEINYGSHYERLAQDLTFIQGNIGQDEYIDLDIGNLYRIRQVTNYAGGQRNYEYIDDGQPLSVNYNVSYPLVVKSNMFKGQGRDAFFSNMLEQRTNGVNEETLEYYYYDYGGDSSSHPLDENDIFSTKRTVQATGGTNNNTLTEFASIKYYKDYPVYLPYSNSEYPDYLGETKIYKEEYYKDNPAVKYKEIVYEFEKGYFNGQTYNGPFLDTKITETYSEIAKETNFQYEYYQNFPSTNQYLNPLSKITAIDPLGNKTATEFFALYDTSMVCNNGWYFGNTANMSKVPFYIINMPKVVEKKDSLNNLLYKETSYYAGISDTSQCYFGQLLDKKVYNKDNLNYYLQTTYEYCKRDTTGGHLYGISIWNKPGTEGNLKKVTDPKGNIARYYYHPISSSEETHLGIPNETDEEGPQYDYPYQPPKVSYKKVYENGSVVLSSSAWQDRRLPTRIDNYVNGEYYLTTYNYYNDAGNLTKNISNNKYLSVLSSDPLDRITSVILPNDFNNSAAYDSTVYDTTYYPIEKTLGIARFGCYEENPYSYALLYNNCGSWYNGTDTAQSKFDLRMAWDGNEFDIRRYPLMNFQDEEISNLTEIEYAHFVFYPTAFYDTAYAFPYQDFVIPQLVPQPDIENPSLNYIGQDLTNLNCPRVGISCTQNPFPWQNYYNFFDVTNLLRTFIISQQHSFEGFLIKYRLLENLNWNEPHPYHYAIMNIGYCAYLPLNCADWGGVYSPVIKIKGTSKSVTSRIIKVYERGTLRYIYDDLNNKVTVLSKLYPEGSSQKDKKNEMTFDGFYKPVKTKMFTSTSVYDSSLTFYNYLDQKGKVTDARNNSTKFSYNEYGTLSKTENADNSTSLVSEGYYSSLTTHWGTYNGFIHKQVYEDETGRNFEKYFDAVGNLLREVKFVSGTTDPDYPYDPDSTFDGNDDPGDLPIFTDYRYDNMYRVTDVYTPNEKTISYIYDGYGRQIRRTTPDAGITKYSYDKNNNLIYSQDENQRHISSGHSTFRTYDGLNRLTVLGFVNLNVRDVPEDELPDEELDVPGSADSLVLVNVYDTLTNAVVSLFNSPPSGYNNIAKNTKGNLVATAYRTRLGDNWNYKYYQYDARGRVIKMWHYIDGLGWKVINNAYNSQNQITYLNYNPGVSGESKLFKYSYDDAARLNDVSIYVGQNPIPEEIEGDFPGDYQNFTSYTYNENSQVDDHNFNDGGLETSYSYNSRNWVQSFHNSPTEIFGYGLVYNSNGNIRIQQTQGTYKSNFTDNTTSLQLTYIYDKSNRLLKGDYRPNEQNTKYDLVNTYDKDGNILTLKRYGSSNNLVDNFSYSYISGTNKLSKTGGLADQYTYDYNGNMTSDDINRNGTFKYDHRNLLIEFRHISPGEGGVANVDTLFQIKYRYDEAGNRIQKTRWKYVGIDPDPEFESDSPYWQLVQNEFYVRDVGGKEITIYDNTNLDQWNVWGLDNVGKVNSDDSRNFYLKDHLGSIRAIVNESYTIISAQDYDAWGNIIENRTYTSNKSKYKFTNKERDYESNYDYFGARYYDSRIGRWGGVEPLMEKYISNSPYIYSLNNVMSLKDVDGKKVKVTGYESSDVKDEIISYASDLEITPSGDYLIAKTLTSAEVNELGAIDQYLYNAITSEKEIVIQSLENPMIGEGEYFLGGAMGNIGTNSITHYVHLKTAEQLSDISIYGVGDLIVHELIEAYLRLCGGIDGKGMSQKEAHKKVIGLIPYGENFKKLGLTDLNPRMASSNGVNTAYLWPSILSEPLKFFEHTVTTRTFIYLDVNRQLREQKGGN